MLRFVSVTMTGARMRLTPALIVALTISVAGQANRVSQTQGRWYDAYREGVTAVQRGDWATAEKRLLDARASGTKPGRRVFTYGDTYIAFLPDYYLGVVYLNSNRPQEAEGAFERVRSQGLIGARDPEYAAFERQGREATFNRSFEEARQLLEKGDFTAANTALGRARATRVDEGKVAALSLDMARRMDMKSAQVQPPAKEQPKQVEPGPVPVPKDTPSPLPTTTANVVKPPPYSPSPAPSSGAPKVPNTLPKGNETFANKGVIIPPSAPTRSPALRNGLLAFFSGDYRGSIPLLQSAAQQPDVSSRARVFLACAKAGLVLTGGGDASLLRESRAEFQNAAVAQALTDVERRFISPKVLEQLERP